MALEDAAVLGSLLSHISSPEQLPFFLKAYEKLRHTRASKTQASSRLNQHVFHLPDGPDQEARDNDMRAAMATELAQREGEAEVTPEGGADNEGNANQWADRKKNIEQFSYDADAVAEQWWQDEGEAMMRKLEQSKA